MALEDCDLSDLGSSWPIYTWCNNRSDGNFTQDRLDRAVANREWCARFRFVESQVLPARSSDHNPILILFNDEPPEPGLSRRGFKFEAKWQLDPECRDVIKAAWEKEGGGVCRLKDIHGRLLACQKSLTLWGKRKFGMDAEILKQKSKRLLELQGDNHPNQVEAIKQIQKEINDILDREDIKWKQRAKQNWFCQGD